MNEKRRESYLNLIQSLLNSPEDEQIALLQQNLELLDDGFAPYLREWATQTIAAMESEEAYNFASNIYSFNIVIGDFPLGSRANNLEIAIACDEIALIVWNGDDYAENWAMIQNSMAIDYSNRIKGDRGENIEKAIECYQAALQVSTRDALPQQWATTQNNLATAYSDRIKFDRGENIEKAIECYQAALQVRTRDALPQQWAMTQNNLGSAYSNRIKGDRGENIESAIECYLAALKVRTRKALPQYWADTQNNLANAYSNRIKGARGENIESAIEFYQAALQVYTRDALPQDWAMTENNLGKAYSDRIKFDRGENIEKAIECFQAALQVYTRDALPQDWAMTQNNLGSAYSNRIKFDRGENIEKAIECYLAALTFCTPTTLPLDCLQTGRNLGNLGFAESLWETAIFGYEKAIEAVEQSREWVTSDNRKRELIEENLNVYEKMMQSCINHQQYHKAIQTIERSKSRYLVELFTNSQIYPKTATETEKQQLDNLRRQIATLQQSLATETPLSPPVVGAVPPCPPSPDSPTQRTTQTNTQNPELSQQQDKLATALKQLEEFLEIFKQREPEFTLTQKVEPIDIPKFQQTLDTKTAIIEWYIGGGEHGNGFAFIITRNNIELITYTATEIAALETWKNNYLDEYRDKQTNKTWQKTLSQKLEQLSQILRLNQIAAKIPPTSNQLILIPHRYLHLFPLHALQFTSESRFNQKITLSNDVIANEVKQSQSLVKPLQSTSSEKPNCRGYLLECFPKGVKYAPSLQLLELVKNRITTRKSPPPNQEQLFALQNPTEDLFNADMEVETIKTRFTPHQILLRNQATKIALNQNKKNLANADYLHFSCHGIFDFDNPLKSSLILADSLEPVLEINPPHPPLAKGGLREENPFADGGPEKDAPKTNRYVTLRSGRKAIPEKCLTLRDIFAELQLPKCSLVTLSACETGLTTSTAITDEYIGLPSGFLYAGSMNVVSSLWAVDDFATAILMIKFYQELPDAGSVAVALNAAQNWMRGVSLPDFEIWARQLKLDKKSRQGVELWLVINSTDKQPFRNPKYWAAFCATGY